MPLSNEEITRLKKQNRKLWFAVIILLVAAIIPWLARFF